MTDQIKVAVTGAAGRMGREVVKMVLDDTELKLVAAIGNSSSAAGDIGSLVGRDPCGILLTNQLETALKDTKPDVMVDFTTPHAAMDNTKMAIRYKVRPVVGTSGLTPQCFEELDMLCRDQKIGCIIAPNFSIGAVLMMKFASEAAKYLPHVEIVEYHGDQKLDAPSGTAVQTAEMIAKNRQKLNQGNPLEKEMLEGARGANYDGFRIHSVRLPGVYAQQEVIFGGFGQTLKIRHDSFDRAGYMPGVNTAIKKVMGIAKLVYGFEHLLD